MYKRYMMGWPRRRISPLWTAFNPNSSMAWARSGISTCLRFSPTRSNIPGWPVQRNDPCTPNRSKQILSNGLPCTAGDRAGINPPGPVPPKIPDAHQEAKESSTSSRNVTTIIPTTLSDKLYTPVASRTPHAVTTYEPVEFGGSEDSVSTFDGGMFGSVSEADRWSVSVQEEPQLWRDKYDPGNDKEKGTSSATNMILIGGIAAAALWLIISK